MNNKVAQILTDRFIEEMNNGTIPWRKPWRGGLNGAVSHSTGKPYAFINQIFLDAGEYITFEQCKKEGGSVKKGAKSEVVFMWIVNKNAVLDSNGKPEVDDNGNELTKTSFSLRYARVFNIKDCDGITPKVNIAENVSALTPDKTAEGVINNYINTSGVKFTACKSDEAFYRPSDDSVTVPILTQYEAVEEYYSTTFHELTHSTGHKSRLDRFTTGKAAAFGGEEYSKEELIAEIGAAALVNYCGLETTKSFKNSAGYLQGWLKALKNDPNLLISAATKAQKAIELILTGYEGVTPDPEGDKPGKKSGTPAKKSAKKSEGGISRAGVKILEKICNSKESSKAGKLITTSGKLAITDGFRVVEVSPDIEVEGKTFENAKFLASRIDDCFNCPVVDEVLLPTIDEVKAKIAADKLNGVKYSTFAIGDRIVNSKYLLDILKLFPEVVRAQLCNKHTIIFNGDNGRALLLEVRK